MTDKGIFSGKTLLSDLDGTMITSDYTLPERNIEAVRRFERQGGRVVIATGRSIRSARPFIEKLGVTMPCVILNGAAAYDYGSGEYLITRPIERDAAAPVLLELMDRFPKMGAEALTYDSLYMIHESRRALFHAQNEGVPYIPRSIDETPEKWLKIVLSGEPDMMDSVLESTQRILPPGLRTFKSMSIYVEILSAAVNKFTMASELFELLGLSMEDCFAIGDYDNDVEMITGASIGAAPANSPERVRSQADFVAGDCAGGAVADFIEYLEKRFM